MKGPINNITGEAAMETEAFEPGEGVRRRIPVKLVSYLIPGLVAFFTFLVFSPALRNGFVNWDDFETIVENQNFRGFSWSHLHWMFTTFHMGHYQPLSWLTFSLDNLFWGLEPFGYHLTNILLHSANAALFYFVSRRLLRLAAPGAEAFPLRLAAAFSALVFAIHPLRVESVAWATERRDVLSGFFLLLTVLSYLKAVGSEMRGKEWQHWIVLSVTLYVLSLLSKASGMMLPLVLVVLDVYPLRRVKGSIIRWFDASARRIWLEKVPFFVAAAAAGAGALTAQQKAGALVTIETHDFTGRIVQSLYGMTFYLLKTLLPTNLAPLYEIPVDTYLLHPRFILAALIFSLLSIGFLMTRRRWPAGLACWTVYLLLLLPVSGIAQSGLQMVADRYSYLACMVWAILFAGALLRYWRSENNRISQRLGGALLIGVLWFVLLGLGILTWKQTQVWHDSERLWSHALAVSPSGMANLHVGRFAAQRGALAEAEKYLRRAVEFNPQNDVFQSNLALVLARQGNLTEATDHFRRALEINPKDPAALNNMGIALAQQGRLDEAIEHFRRSLEIKPNDASGHTNLANLLLDRGDVESAIKHLRIAIGIDPKDADIYNTLAIISAKRGNLAEATEYLRRVVELKPDDSAAANNLAITLAKQGRLEEAAQSFGAALRIDPNLAEAHAGLARVLTAQKKPEDAMNHYQEALRILKAQQKVEGTRESKR